MTQGSLLDVDAVMAEMERRATLRATTVNGVILIGPAQDASVGEVLKELGTGQARRAAPTAWALAFEQQVEAFVRAGTPFTSEDVTRAVGMPPHGNAVGAVMVAVARKIHLRRTGRYVPATAPQARARVLCEWVGPSPAIGADQ